MHHNRIMQGRSTTANSNATIKSIAFGGSTQVLLIAAAVETRGPLLLHSFRI